ncbi:MAG: LysM peptidoglycan-binding domain-containing protein, partial [Fibrobacter sp.]|nr:LysM peptidoglycan-binding domain-containing protein [Fibrobacter sp.]
RGDCLGKIARKYGISITRLKQLNGIKGNMIRPGQVLRCS